MVDSIKKPIMDFKTIVLKASEITNLSTEEIDYSLSTLKESDESILKGLSVIDRLEMQKFIKLRNLFNLVLKNVDHTTYVRFTLEYRYFFKQLKI